MNDDFLFDRTGPEDPEITQLETLLRPYRYTPHRSRGSVVALAMAALVLLTVGAIAFWPTGPTPWSVETASCTGCLWESGAALDTQDQAVVQLADRGTLTAAEASLLHLEDRDGRAHLRLDKGRVEVRVDAPARWLIIDIPGVKVVDLGCAYTLAVASDGTGVVEVRSGAVALEGRGHRTFVPAGGFAASWPSGHTGLPVMSGASRAAVEAVDRFDRGEGMEDLLLHLNRSVDAVTLWHVLARVHPSQRRDVALALAALIPEGLPDSTESLVTANEEELDALLGFLIGRTL